MRIHFVYSSDKCTLGLWVWHVIFSKTSYGLPFRLIQLCFIIEPKLCQQVGTIVYIILLKTSVIDSEQHSFKQNLELCHCQQNNFISSLAISIVKLIANHLFVRWRSCGGTTSQLHPSGFKSCRSHLYSMGLPYSLSIRNKCWIGSKNDFATRSRNATRNHQFIVLELSTYTLPMVHRPWFCYLLVSSSDASS